MLSGFINNNPPDFGIISFEGVTLSNTYKSYSSFGILLTSFVLYKLIFSKLLKLFSKNTFFSVINNTFFSLLLPITS